MRSMLVSQGFVIALVRAFFQALIHAADVFSCLPEAVVISTHHYKLALDVLNLYHFFLCMFSCLFRVDKKVRASCYISRAFGFFFYFVIVFRVGINERHIGKRLALP